MPFNEILMPEEIRLFLVDLLKEANAWPDAEELQQRMLVDLFTRLQAKLLLTFTEYLSEEQMEAYGKLAQTDYTTANEYLQSQLPQYNAIFLKTLAEFREVFLGK
jgi:hypothetical protein